MLRQRRLPRAAITAILVAVALLTSSSAWAGNAHPDRPTQRTAFKKALAHAKSGDSQWRAEAKNLKAYPLYPWLPAAALEHDLRHLDVAQVKAYLQRYPNLLPAQDLRRHFLRELARRQDWVDFLQLYQPGMGNTLACDALRAKLAQGKALRWRDLENLWKSPSLPSVCTPVQKWAHSHGLLTGKRLWQRIDRAVDADRGGTVAWLARWLHGRERTQAQHLAQALRQPTRAAKAAPSWSDTRHNRQAATLAMVRVARHSTDRADQLWPAVRHHLHLSTDQLHRVEAAIALYAGTDFRDDALHRLASLPEAARTDATRAWRVRVALAQQNWKAALKALDNLDTAQKQQGEWRYLRARVLAKLGRTGAAHKLYAQQATSATYYGFLAADQADLPYAICEHSFDRDGKAEKALLRRPALQRAFELHAVGLLHDARRVWHRALADASSRQQQLAAWLAWKRGWYDRAIRAFSHGDLKQLYQQRFPLARDDDVSTQAKAAGIDPAWAYGLIRAESAWMPDAHSGADARGLMQLLPSTARRVAHRHQIPWHGDLYNPRVNVALGTRYLAHVAARFGGAPYLATAAYNAGPGRVDRWLAARGQLSPDLFVATIPFRETRHYVMRVLAYSVIYDWRLHGNAVALSQRLPPQDHKYQPPTANTPRKSVVCPAHTAVAAASQSDGRSHSPAQQSQ